ncbi:hypothetical protein GGS26DRAFT_522604 [Hypomontagnella submonticulosa]|nr:hypothetical protein GGS26DRAFT_522604 [Hypomontagnella submonticulosa]
MGLGLRSLILKPARLFAPWFFLLPLCLTLRSPLSSFIVRATILRQLPTLDIIWLPYGSGYALRERCFLEYVSRNARVQVGQSRTK